MGTMKRWLRSARLKARTLFRRRDVERELADELRFHIDLETEKNLRDGMAPAAARRAALIAFGGLDRFTEATREGLGLGGWDTLSQDVRYALRGVRRSPGFSIVVVLTVALGIGGTTAIFSVVNGVLLRPLPFPESDRLVRIWAEAPERGDRFLSLTHQDLDALREQAGTFTDLAGFSQADRVLTDERNRPSQVEVARVSAGFFRTLGATFALGRGFSDDEVRLGAPLAILSHGLWERRYGADPGVIGATVSVEGDPVTLVGVLASDQSFPSNADLWRPLTSDARDDDDREYLVVGRLADAVSLTAASSEVDAIANRRARQAPASNAGLGMWIQPLHAMVTRDVRAPLLMLLAAVAMVLVIACVNVANLLLARGSSRQAELAVRAALGAGRRRVVRQLLTESLVFAAAGGLLGVVAGGWLLRLFQRLLPVETPMLQDVAMDGRVLLVAAAATAVSGVAFGLVPALDATRGLLRRGLSRAGRGLAPRHRIQAGLVTLEIALSTVVVISAGLLATSYGRLTRVDRGFEERDLLVVPLRPLHEPQGAEARAYFDRARNELASLPGVESVGLGLRSPLYPRGINLRIFGMEGLPEPADGTPQAGVQTAAPDYFTTLGVAVLGGRGLASTDRPETEAVAVINESFARAYFGSVGLDPVGFEFRRPSWADGTTMDVRIVGVVADLVAGAGQPVQPQMFLPLHQIPTHDLTAVVRFGGDPATMAATVRSALWALDPTLPLDRMATAEQHLRAELASERFNTVLLGIFAGMALVLAGIGIYGVMAFQVAERTREMGLRRALGAPESRVVGLVIGRGFRLAMVGVGAGILASIWTGRAMESLLFGIGSVHLPTLALVSAVLFAAAMVASLGPAIRATRADPMAALRSD